MPTLKSAHPTSASIPGYLEVRLTEQAHQLIAEVLPLGGRAIDATSGNGHDTLFLAQQVGSGGHVFAVDIQPEAIATTQLRLAAAGWAKNCDLRVLDHAQLGQALPSAFRGTTDSVLFNLGYLPGGDHTLITQVTTTLPALQASLEALRKGGRLVTVVYPGHEGGLEESAQVAEFGERCAAQGHEVHIYHHNPLTRNPWILSVTRRE